MSRVFLTMAMSLDGYLTGPDDDADNPAGTGGMRLMDWPRLWSSSTPGVLDVIDIQLRRALQAPGTLHLRDDVIDAARVGGA